MEKIIRKAAFSDIGKMRELWAECFPEDVEFSEFFFERIFSLSCASVCEVCGEVAAMLHAFPYEFDTPDGKLLAKYIYGVGTAKKHRSLGLAGKLLSSVENSCDFLVLIPQQDSLFDFYKKHGYTEIFEVAKVIPEVTKGEKAVKAGKEDIPKLQLMYENMCRGSIHPVRSCEYWRLLIDEFEFFGGGVSIFDSGYCAHFEHNEKNIISELCSVGSTCALHTEKPAVVPGKGVRLGAAKLISQKAKKIFDKGYPRYINLMHN